MCEKVRGDKHIDYVWFNTGLEFQATKDHLDYLEQRYGIEILRLRSEKPVPYCVHEYGVPFKSKRISEMVQKLQEIGFQWEDEPLDVLTERYPNAREALRWWCNDHDRNMKFDLPSKFDIRLNPWLKEWLMTNPPDFPISNVCCKYAKKDLAHKYIDEQKKDLEIIGVRKAEGGIRAATKTCFIERDGCDSFRPIFWLTNEDKRYYEEHFGIVHSACYTKYGLKRTGCVGCPFALDLEGNLEAVKLNEPRLYKACWNVFGKAYEYTRQFRSFRKEMNDKKKNPDQITMYELGFGQEEDDDDLL